MEMSSTQMNMKQSLSLLKLFFCIFSPVDIWQAYKNIIYWVRTRSSIRIPSSQKLGNKKCVILSPWAYDDLYQPQVHDQFKFKLRPSQNNLEILK